MDCCNYGEYRGQYAWEYGYGQYAPAPHYYSPYAPYSREYSPHEQYARYYRYQDYAPTLQHHVDRERSLLEYGGAAAGYLGPKEARARRGGGRRETERTRTRTPARQLHVPTPPLDCGGISRVPSGYGGSHASSWSHYQMGGSGWGGAWTARPNDGVPTHRDPLRHLAAMHDHCSIRNKTQMPLMEQSPAPTESRGVFYEECSYPPRGAEAPRPRTLAPEFVDYASAPVTASYERARTATPVPPAPSAPTTIPLPAFQQAFGSTEIGKFAEAFSRAEAAHDADTADASLDIFSEWEAPETPWPAANPRPLKCENSH